MAKRTFTARTFKARTFGGRTWAGPTTDPEPTGQTLTWDSLPNRLRWTTPGSPILYDYEDRLRLHWEPKQ